MTLTLDLPKELENELTAEAARLGLPVSEYARRLLSSGRTPGASPKTGAELVAYWQREGVAGSRPEISDSQELARAIRRQAEEGFRS
ncbi:MAG TPA: hypothetical protein VFE33_16335 [Thermoanaerobaculia bacterium]|nr:hypothetical protein [Thermoanaerobaculia bacterium]